VSEPRPLRIGRFDGSPLPVFYPEDIQKVHGEQDQLALIQLGVWDALVRFDGSEWVQVHPGDEWLERYDAAKRKP
jgi:hypothetical protein